MFNRTIDFGLIFALMVGCACASGANSGASSGPGASAASSVTDGSASTAASNSPSGSNAPVAPSTSASGPTGSTSAQNANLAQGVNSAISFHAYLEPVTATYDSIEGVSKSANGNSLILTDDPNACDHAALARVLIGSTTVRIFDPNFLLAAKAIGVPVNVADSNNTLMYVWAINYDNGGDPNGPLLCSAPGYQGIDIGVGSFTIDAGGKLDVVLPYPLKSRGVDTFVSTCASAMRAQYRDSVSPGHQARFPEFCAAP